MEGYTLEDENLWIFKDTKCNVLYKIKQIFNYERNDKKITELLKSWAIELEKDYIYLEIVKNLMSLEEKVKYIFNFNLNDNINSQEIKNDKWDIVYIVTYSPR